MAGAAAREHAPESRLSLARAVFVRKGGAGPTVSDCVHSGRTVANAATPGTAPMRQP